MTEEKLEADSGRRPRRSRSVFGPIALIAVGLFFLLDNLGILPPLNWSAALQYWPLLLIFLGLNVLVVQARPPIGTTLSLLVALAAVVAFGYLLLTGADNPAIRSLGLNPAPTELQEETFEVGLDGAQTAEITIDMGNQSTTVEAGSDGTTLVSGTVWTANGLRLEPSSSGDGRAVEVRIGERTDPTRLFNAGTLLNGDKVWEIRLNPSVPTDLHLDVGNGSLNAAIQSLRLTGLEIDGGNGTVMAELPDGAYETTVDGGNGSMRLMLPAAGEQELLIDGGNGTTVLELPAGMAARVEYDRGSGGVRVDDRFVLVRGDNDEGVYETRDYAGASDRIRIRVSTGTGSLSVVQP